MNSHQQTDELEARFARHGLRCTVQRRAIYELLAATDVHPTADEIHRRLSPGSDVSLATVYNALEAFCRCGLAQKMNSSEGEGSARYDATTHPHLHVRDDRRGRLLDVPSDLSQQVLAHIPRDLIQEIERRLGVKVRDVQVELLAE